jgi:hypothetical protein
MITLCQPNGHNRTRICDLFDVNDTGLSSAVVAYQQSQAFSINDDGNTGGICSDYMGLRSAYAG